MTLIHKLAAVMCKRAGLRLLWVEQDDYTHEAKSPQARGKSKAIAPIEAIHPTSGEHVF